VAALTYLDTHVAAWLFAGRADLLSKNAQRAVREGDLLVSPAVLLELQYLYETKRTNEPGRRVIDDLRHRLGLRVCDLFFEDVVGRALEQRWTRDPFDRLIVGQATLRGAALVGVPAGSRRSRSKTTARSVPDAYWRAGASMGSSRPCRSTHTSVRPAPWSPPAPPGPYTKVPSRAISNAAAPVSVVITCGNTGTNPTTLRAHSEHARCGPSSTPYTR